MIATKKCTKCGEEKEREDFHVDRSQSSGLKPACRICTNKVKAQWRLKNKSKVRRQRRESYERNRDSYLKYMRSSDRRRRHFEWKLEREYGITIDDYESLLEEQGFVCAICGLPPCEENGHRKKARLCVDHCHESGRVRGLLCTMCNAALGYLRDDPVLATRSSEYLMTR